MTQLKSNALSVSAEQVRVLVQQSEALAMESIEVGIEAGRLLVQAKSECKHGEWLPFLERAGIAERKAQRLMQIARSGLTSDTVTEMGGMKAALHWLSLRRLPDATCGLSITPHSTVANPYEAFEAAFIWPSVDHPDHYYVAHIMDSPDGGSSSVVTKCPLQGKDLPSDMDFNPVWEVVDRMMVTPKTSWHFHHANGRAVSIIAEGLGIADAVRQTAEAELAEGNRADAMRLEQAATDLAHEEEIEPEAMLAAQAVDDFKSHLASFSPEMQAAMLVSLRDHQQAA